MSLLFILNQKEPELAVAEAKAVAYGWRWWEHKETPAAGTLLLPRQRVRLDRIKRSSPGLSHRVIKVIAVCAPGNLRTTLSALPWPRLLKRQSYRVRLTSSDRTYSERALANIIAAAHKGVVDLEHPKTIVDIVITPEQAYVGLRVWENSEDFQARRAHLLPATHPSMMHPAMARALANISCARTIHDPFCGAGGLLLEAGLAGRQVSGADVSPEMIVRTRRNCAEYGLRPALRVADATDWLPRTQSMVTDLPYGKSTRPVALSHLYEAFLTRAARSTRRAVVGLPTALPAPHGWAVRAHLTSYVHKSMTKHFYVLERD
jgi:tRNA (guanine10-N2)-dimethyltransferase